ncbi:MAG TPA: hypothetical protein VGO57_06610 [Verrucomicrobiae bacterium]|jgi:hypothetical protein
MKTRTLTIFKSTIILWLMAMGSSCSTESKLRHYSGDGEIKAQPDYGLIGGGGGYTLKFAPIPLDGKAHFIYHLKGLPAGKTDVYFAIEDPHAWVDRDLYTWYQTNASESKKQEYNYACYEDLNGTLAMSLKDREGKYVFQFEKKLSELTWSSGSEPKHVVELYDRRSMGCALDGRDYVLEITVTPDAILSPDKGYILFQGGGHEPISIGL